MKFRPGQYFTRETLIPFFVLLTFIAVGGLVFGGFGFSGWEKTRKQGREIHHLEHEKVILQKKIADITTILNDVDEGYFYLTGEGILFNLTGYPSDVVFSLNCSDSLIFLPGDAGWKARFTTAVYLDGTTNIIASYSGEFVGFIIQAYYGEYVYPEYGEDAISFPCDPAYPGDFVDVLVLGEGITEVAGFSAEYGIDWYYDC